MILIVRGIIIIRMPILRGGKNKESSAGGSRGEHQEIQGGEECFAGAVGLRCGIGSDLHRRGRKGRAESDDLIGAQG